MQIHHYLFSIRSFFFVHFAIFIPSILVVIDIYMGTFYNKGNRNVITFCFSFY